MDKDKVLDLSSHLFQRVASFLHSFGASMGPNGRRTRVLISFREWLHSYNEKGPDASKLEIQGSHLFQRVASFLRFICFIYTSMEQYMFSSLSESGFIPTPSRGWEC